MVGSLRSRATRVGCGPNNSRRMNKQMSSKQVFIVIQSDAYEGTRWVEGVFAKRETAVAYVATQEAELAEDGMEESYKFEVETSFLNEE